jgi:hypothetical protein
VDGSVRGEVLALAVSAGFAVDVAYCSHNQMVLGIRALERLAEGELPSDEMERALLENLRLVLQTTAAAEGRGGSLAVQSRLPRWTHLRQISPSAADAYAAVLRYHQVEVPECLV